MNILFFDTETTGLPRPNEAPDHPSQPHIVQLACVMHDDAGLERHAISLIVDPGVVIPPKAAEIHGLTTEVVQRHGVAPEMAAMMFCHMLAQADRLVAHKAEFDVAIIKTLFRRLRIVPVKQPQRVECTMRQATDIVRLPPSEKMVAAGITRPKPPKLAECVKHFFDEDLDGAHDAMVDVRACARVWWHIRGMPLAEKQAA